MREHTVGRNVVVRRVAGYAVGVYLPIAGIGQFVEGMDRCSAVARLSAGASGRSSARSVGCSQEDTALWLRAEQGREAITVAHLGLRWAH